MIVTIAGSTDFPIEVAAHGILRTIVTLPINAKLLLRKGLRRDANPFEKLVAGIAATLSMPTEWCVPDTGGRRAVYLRDIAMVERSDAVLAFFHPDRPMQGGTGHLVDTALSIGRPVWAWTIADSRDALVRVGEDEGELATVLRDLTVLT